MRIGIIGGGLMGTALAYFLSEAGDQVTLLEQGNNLGGLNSSIEFADGLSVARYQHSILPNDQTIRSLCSQLGLDDELVFGKAYSGFVLDGKIQALTGIKDFVSFTPLGLLDRMRLGKTILSAVGKPDPSLDRISVKEWLITVGGEQAYERIWRPLLEAKFDGVYDTVPATYMWAWLNRVAGSRRAANLKSQVIYLRRGHYSLIQALADAFLKRGGRIETNVRVREIDISGGRLQRVRTHTGTMEFDAMVSAIATSTFARLIPGADKTYLEQLEKSKYLGLICPVMVLDRPLSEYWTLSMTDSMSPFANIIETRHPERPDYSVVYLPRYTAPDNDWMGVPDEDIRTAWLNHLKTVFPDFNERQIIHFSVSRSRFVEPVYAMHTLDNPIALQTPYAGLFLANSSQVYPELPTSEAVIVHARAAAKFIHKTAASLPPASLAENAEIQ